MGIPECVPWRATGKILGEGGQGQVHLVVSQDDPDGPEYALKELSNTESEQALKRFMREIKVVKKLTEQSRASSNSGIARIVDHSKPDDGYQYYVMEYYVGAKTLAEIIFAPSSNPYHGNVLKSLGLFEQIVRAIEEYGASNSSIVHRDIKPQNILVLPDDTIKLIDFGICHFEDGETITLTDENVGPRNYMAPECGFGSNEPVGIHSDLYPAAKVLWSTITSKRVFDRESPVFGELSMIQMFPNQPKTWHLMRIFELTIRLSPVDRINGVRPLLTEISNLRYVIKAGYPPLEDTRYRCPSVDGSVLQTFLRHTTFSRFQGQARRPVLSCVSIAVLYFSATLRSCRIALTTGANLVEHLCYLSSTVHLSSQDGEEQNGL